jgi:hypothetical protein
MPRWTIPLVKEIESNLILFGYDPGSDELFERELESREEYEAELARVRTRIPEETLEQRLAALDW